MSYKIYKFLSINAFTRDVLLTEKFYFGDWKNMNDPLEGFFQYSKDKLTDSNIIDLYNSKNLYGVSCFSKTYRSILMWSHYADDHKGICVEVLIDEELCREKNIDIVEINYMKSIATIADPGADAKSLLSRKLFPWKYEKEIRLFSNGKNSQKRIGKISRIILGSNISPDHKELINTYVGDRNIKIIQAKININTSNIVIR